MRKYRSNINFDALNQATESLQCEQDIKKCTSFFKKHLKHISTSKRSKVLASLKQLHLEFKSYHNDENLNTFSSGLSDLEKRANEFIKEYLKQPFIKEFNKEFECDIEFTPQKQPESMIQNIFTNMSVQYQKSIVSLKKSINNKSKLLNYSHFCLHNYGLHPSIYKRNNNSKRFNLLIFKENSLTGFEKYRILLSWDELETDFLNPYFQKRPIILQGTTIKPSHLYTIKITSTLLKDDEIELFALQNDFDWNNNHKDSLAFIEYSDDETDFILNSQKRSVTAFYAEVQQLLQPYSNAHKLYSEALSKLESGIYERNTLDDLRLSLEQLCKKILGQNYSLEGQVRKRVLKDYLKNKKANPHINNLTKELINFYTLYHNDAVKHNDKVKKNEVEYIFDLTSTFMKFLISV